MTDRDVLIWEKIKRYWQNRWMILKGGKQPNNFDHCYQKRSLISQEGKLYSEEILINQFPHLVIWGTFGSGKTYLLHSIAQMVLASNQALFPLWIDLSLVEALSVEAIWQQNQLDREDVNYLLEDGKGIILIDNFQRNQRNQLHQFYVYYAQNRIITATRCHLKINDINLPLFKLLNLEDRQVIQFIHFHFQENYIIANEIIHGQSELHPLRTTPLYLDIICNSPIHYDNARLLQIWLDLVNPLIISDADLRVLQKLAIVAIIEEKSKLCRSKIEYLCRSEMLNPIEFINNAITAGILVEYQDSYLFNGQAITNYLAAQGIAFTQDPYIKWDYQRQISFRVNQLQYHSLIRFLWEFLQDKQPFFELLQNNVENIILPNSQESKLLEWINQQLCLTKLEYSKEVNQAIYLGFLLATQFSVDTILLPSQSLPILLEPKLAVPLALVVAPSVALDMAINMSLYRALDEPTQFSDQSKRAQTQIQRHKAEEFMYWWESERQQTIELLKIVQEQCNKYVRIVNLSLNQWQKLRDYYQAKFLLVMCHSVSNLSTQPTVETQAQTTILHNTEAQNQIQVEKLQQEIQALQVKIDFLLLERSKISANLDNMFKLWKKLQPQMVLIDRLLNSHVWKKLEQQMKQNSKQ